MNMEIFSIVYCIIAAIYYFSPLPDYYFLKALKRFGFEPGNGKEPSIWLSFVISLPSHMFFFIAIAQVYIYTRLV